ncbi:50S ribosomal protein L24 [Catalinimonas niigatensis]|uniref:50S ribosomal protein L24 n=1 Tax=Catalinimonas niigatensis TaxID=1397264 RepID=UPI0026653ED1|nr:50S ribosomal protein L24 [Catalinimonas niigatensis]WPP52506.1 50S ribosomal protein L24 [Catalinimonas niigatensis]
MKTFKKKLHIKKDDTVKVIAGNHKGRTAKVLEVFPEKNKAIVEGINLVTKHVKPSAQNPEGGRNEKEAAIHVSKLMLVDPSTGEPTRVGRKQNDKGKLQRYSKKTGEFI